MATPPSPNHAFSISPPIVKTARKLPVKRKAPSSQSQHTPTTPQADDPHHPLAILTHPPLPAAHHDDEDEDDDDLPSSPDHGGADGRSSYRYNRLWSEPDEIRFLRALLQSRSDGYRFPRDMPRFYDRFRASMSRSYTRTQFSEKLRRLRKKFRHVSARVRRRGAAIALKTPHEKVVYELSLRLWGSDNPNALDEGDQTPGDAPAPAAAVEASVRPASGPAQETVVIIRHEPASAPPSLPSPPPSKTATSPLVRPKQEVLDPDQSVGKSEADEELGRITARTVVGVLDESIKDIRTVLVGRAERNGGRGGRGRKRNIKKEWGRQQVAEFDVLSQRLKLVLETAVSNLRNSRGSTGTR
ncbi:uncharacterized protein LOC116263361 [Nymphaea colorata]|nr:uncharacterized protein LOC116263361 [Nymphaea colorata]